MAKPNVSLSFILELAANQAASYSEDCRYMSGLIDPIVLNGMPKRKRQQYAEEKDYWDSIFERLKELQKILAVEDIDFIW